MITARLAAALFLAAAIPAAARDAPKEIPVAYGDLDLGTAAGQSALKLRLQDAAAQLCSPALTWDHPGSEQSIRQHREIYVACIGRLSERAMAQAMVSDRTSRN